MAKVVLIENKAKYNVEAKRLFEEFQTFLGVHSLSNLRILNCYAFYDMDEELFQDMINSLLFDEKTDIKYLSMDEVGAYDAAFRVSHKDGQYNQREDMINEMIKIKYGSDAFVKPSKILLLNGVNESELQKIKSYYINYVDSKQMALDDFVFEKPVKFTGEIEFVKGFNRMNEEELKYLQEDLSMDMDDLKFVQDYFKKENRDPSVCELKMIDTYWSDHCRHTTFLTEITDIEIKDGAYKKVFEEALNSYRESREFVHGGQKPLCLMDLATINMKELKKKGILDNLEDSDEVNACSIEIKADIDGTDHDYLLMFKNETHNHPTEIEPYGGAHTCIGGGIRDPLSARSYVFQAMRITGAKSPFTPFEDTLENKLPQRKLCQMAMNGYSDYGNQIGCTGGYVTEVYHDGFEAKRMELGALVSGVKKADITREHPKEGDVILLLGARTGRDGLGAAVGSSKVQTVKSLEKAGAEVQKGNPYEERNIIRLFRNPKATKLIKKCNDFGAGGVSVAIGELASGLEIDLSKVKLKYEGLNDWEIALSESQERMAVVVAKENLEEFLGYVKEEDVDFSEVARVTADERVRMVFNGMTSVDIKREFLDTNGVRKKTCAALESASNADYLLKDQAEILIKSKAQGDGQAKTQAKDQVQAEDQAQIKEQAKNIDHERLWKQILTDINAASQKNLISNFDNTHGRATVLSQLGGINRLTPQEGMVAKLPIMDGETTTCSIMTFGYDPFLSEQNEFLGGYYAVISSLAKQVALGADVDKIRLSFQEFYERLGDSPEKWGKPLKSLLGAFSVLKAFDLATIGGKDSMSGSFKELHVPPSLLSFAVSYDKVDKIVSKELKQAGSKVLFAYAKRDELGLLDLKATKKLYQQIKAAVDKKLILAMSSVEGSIVKTLAQMSFGNDIGVKIESDTALYTNFLGSLILEVAEADVDKLEFEFEVLGETVLDHIIIGEESLCLEELKSVYTTVFDSVYDDFGTILEEDASKNLTINPLQSNKVKEYKVKERSTSPSAKEKLKVLIPVFKGTTGEYDMSAAFKEVGAHVDTMVFKFRTKEELEVSIREFAQKLPDYDVLAIASGAVMGNEPEQKGAAVDFIFTHPLLIDRLNEFAKREDKLIIGVAEGLQTLIRTGLIEFGEVKKAVNASMIESANVSATSIRVLQNRGEKFISAMAKVKVVSEKSPFMLSHQTGDVYDAPIALKAGRIEMDDETFEKLEKNGQIASVFEGLNVTDSCHAIEALTSPNGRVFGCLCGVDRMKEELYKNLEISALPKIFESVKKYFEE